MDEGSNVQGGNNVLPLSDYSFLERSVHEVYIWIWFIVHVWRCDQFSALSWKRIASFELKSFVTIFILFALPLESFYDIISTKIKYVEGFYVFVGVDNVIRAKPIWLWSEENQLWSMPCYYILMAGISFQTITLFLLQCFWNYLTNSIAKQSFMSRGEFSLYIVWGVICIGTFPLLPILLRNHITWLEVIPQLVYATQLLILVLLGIRTHVKFIKLIQITSSHKNSSNVIAKIRYFIDMNKLLTAALAITCVAFYLLSIDILTSKLINRSKFASDLLIAHVNFAAIIEWLALILIFYPRKGFVGTGAGGTSFNTNLSSNIIATSQISTNTNNQKLIVPPGSGAGISVNPYSPTNNNFSINEKRYQSPSIVGKNSTDQIRYNYDNNYDDNNNNNNNNNYKPIQPIQPIPVKSNNDITRDVKEISQKPLQKQSSFKKFKKKSASPIPKSDSNSDLGNHSDNNEGSSKSISYLKRNISISRDGKMLYGETKPLGKVKGAEFVAVEKADPSFIPSYYFINEQKDKDGNIHKVPSLIYDKFGEEMSIGEISSNSSNSNQGITQGVVQQENIVPQQGTIQENNNVMLEDGENYGENYGSDDDDDGYFYAL